MGLEYSLRLEKDGEVVDASKAGEPLMYVHGNGQIIQGLERELEGMTPEDQKDVEVAPQDAYGDPNPNMVMKVPPSHLPKSLGRELGTEVEATNPDGHKMLGKIVEVDDKNISIDFNHPLAGKTLFFAVKIVSVETAPK